MKSRGHFVAILIVALQFSVARAQIVMVNQAGYLPDQQKFVYSTDRADSFFVIDAASGAIRYKGAFTRASSNDAATGSATYAGDFTSLESDGRYRVATSLSDSSYPFTISDNVFQDVYRESLKSFYFQRCGMALTPQHAGVYARGTCHTNDATFHLSTGKTGSMKATGGWHDAGDYGKYVVNAGVTVGTLLMAYELFPSKFKCDDLNIPESGNGVPDILDEVRYELDWLFEMQDPLDGGVYFKVTPANFSGFIMPSQDTSTRYVYGKSTTATGDFAAAMAMAARIYSRFDTAFASRCLHAALAAWGYLSANSKIVPAGGFHNPEGTRTGEYGDPNDSDERLWAAAELYISTGSDNFNTYFADNCGGRDAFASTMAWRNVRDLGLLDYLTCDRTNSDSTLKGTLLRSFDTYCESLVRIASNDGLNVSILPSQYVWGSNGEVLNNAVVLIVGYTLTGKKEYYNTALEQLNYVLGCNMKDMSYITGVGTASPMHIHHRPSASDGIAEPVPGLLAGGPDRGRYDAVLRSMYTDSTPPAKCYVDNQGSYASNEIAINWNAPLVFVSGYFNEAP